MKVIRLNKEKQMSEEFEIKNTKQLQLKSLKLFANELDYWYNDFCGNFVKHHDFHNPEPTDKLIISFQTMVSLHNKMNHDNHGKEYERLGFNFYLWNKAKASKIVRHVNLTMNKRTKYLYCHKNMVQFVHTAYEDMFLGECK